MLLLHTENFPNYGLDRIFEITKKCGFDGVEISIGENLDTHDAEYLKSLEKRHGVRILAFSLEMKNQENFLEQFEKVVANFPGTTVNLGSAEILSFKYKNWISQKMPRMARKFGLKINRKNAPFKLFFGIFPQRTENSLFSLRSAGNVCLDLSALWASHEEIMRTINFFDSRLRHVYLSNVARNKPYCPLPNGILPLESFLTRLSRENFLGNFTLRLSPREIFIDDFDKMCKILFESREFFEKYFA